MAEYVIAFGKEGYIKYTSHLDMLRFFKRAFRRAGLELAYSQGFNPHPKMGFAQPLSLGYSADRELLEFTTEREYTKEEIFSVLEPNLAEGLTLRGFGTVNTKKSLAAQVDSADYRVTYPAAFDPEKTPETAAAYLAQPEIMAEKFSKKKHKTVSSDIRPKIRDLKCSQDAAGKLVLDMKVDCGSASNLSPEQVIQTFSAFAGIDCPRYEIEVIRKDLHISPEDAVTWL